ncbi:hypothetical protein G6F59_018494 [Rhizopus arrhizus]|nr:hypothetical protein G6F59_018494 [Rhizopus arrhizus]
MLSAYIDLKMADVNRLRMTTHPVEFDMQKPGPTPRAPPGRGSTVCPPGITPGGQGAGFRRRRRGRVPLSPCHSGSVKNECSSSRSAGPVRVAGQRARSE